MAVPRRFFQLCDLEPGHGACFRSRFFNAADPARAGNRRDLVSYIPPQRHYPGRTFAPALCALDLEPDLLFDAIKVCSLLGLGKYRKFYPEGTRSDLMDFCRKLTDYMIYETNYLNLGEVHKLAKRNKMRCSFRYTEEYYLNKLRQLLGKPLKYEYAPVRHPWRERVLFSFLARPASITLVLEKQNTY